MVDIPAVGELTTVVNLIALADVGFSPRKYAKVHGIGLQKEAHLPLIAQTRDGARSFPRVLEGGQQQRDQQRDDADDDQKLDERETM